jgi:hypothetical protein
MPMFVIMLVLGHGFITVFDLLQLRFHYPCWVNKSTDISECLLKHHVYFKHCSKILNIDSLKKNMLHNGYFKYTSNINVFIMISTNLNVLIVFNSGRSEFVLSYSKSSTFKQNIYFKMYPKCSQIFLSKL